MGFVTAYATDNLGRVVKITQPDPDGAGPQGSPTTEIHYNKLGQVKRQSDALGHTTKTRYDAHGRPVRTTDAEGGVTRHKYDAHGNRIKLRDPDGNDTVWQHDALDRVIAETNALGSRAYEYDQVGNLLEKFDRNNRITQYDYDALYRRTSETWLDAAENPIHTITYEHTEAGAPYRIWDGTDYYESFYDDRGQANSLETTRGDLPYYFQLQYFDAEGNRTDFYTTVTSAEVFHNHYEYDSLGRMESVAQTSGPGVVSGKQVQFSYDRLSRWDTIKRYADLAGTQLVVTSDHDYDNASRLTDLTHSKGATILADYDWAYDVGNRITQFVSLTDGTVDYTHDDTDQLEGADYDYQADEAYQYDDAGNRINNGYTVGVNNRMTSDGTYAYLYDNEGNRTAKFIDNDSSGTLTTGDTEVTEYVWDHRNRLIEVTTRATAGGAATKVVEHTYDYLNRWIQKQVDDNADGAFDREEHFVYDGAETVLRYDDNSEYALTNAYLFGPAVDQVLADEPIANLQPGGDVRWPLADNIGTIRDVAVYDSQQDITTIAMHRLYNAFGKITQQTGAVDTLMANTGKPLDQDTGLQNHHHRWYDPETGRWSSEDWIWDDANSYRYVGNSPTNFIDPSGLGKLKVIKGLKNVLFDEDTAEFVLKNKKRIKVRNAKFIDCDVPLDALEELTNVSKDTIAKLRNEYGNDLSIKFNKHGQPDFSRWRKAKVKIANPGASNCADQAWKELAKNDAALYKKLWPNKEDYEWHHALDESLQLIDRDLHKAYQHTGLNSILKKMGAVGMMFPGVAALSEGRINDGLREAAVEVTPPTAVAKFFAETIGWFFESAKDQIYGEEQQKKNREWKKSMF